MDETSKSTTSKSATSTNSTTSSFERRPPLGRVALVWRGDPGAGVPEPGTTRFHLIFSALGALGVAAEPVLYSEEAEEAVRARLLDDGRRAGLGRPAERRQGPLAARPAAPRHRGRRRLGQHPSGRHLENGRQGGALPHARAGLGHRHRPLCFGAGLRRALPARLAASGPRVLKQNRGNGGQGVWKVELVDAGARPLRRTRPSAFFTRCAAASRKSFRSARSWIAATSISSAAAVSSTRRFNPACRKE